MTLARSEKPWRCRARAAAGLLSLALLSPAAHADALTPDDVAGVLDDQPVTLGEIDQVVEGELSRKWREIASILKTSAQAICAERVLPTHLAAAGDSDVPTWRAALWERARPTADQIATALAQNPETAVQAAVPLQAAHALHVDAYRRAVSTATASLLEGAYATRPALHDPDARFDVPPLAERERAAVLADCGNRVVTRGEVEAFAAFPLYRRRAAIVATACRQLAPDYTMPLVLARLAAQQGRSVDDLEREGEGEVAPVTEALVETVARERYGSVGVAERAKVRLALTAVRRSEARMAWREALRGRTVASCSLAAPPKPRVTLRERAPTLQAGPGGAGVPAVLFGAFRCRHCAATWETVSVLRADATVKLSLSFRHYFPDKSLLAFEDALAAECAGAQGRFRDYVAARLAADPASSGWGGVVLPGLDAAQLASCAEDARTAVRILEDVEEGHRLGFGEAIPSWVVGERPRRGFQGEANLRDMIDAARRET